MFTFTSIDCRQVKDQIRRGTVLNWETCRVLQLERIRHILIGDKREIRTFSLLNTSADDWVGNN